MSHSPHCIWMYTLLSRFQCRRNLSGRWSLLIGWLPVRSWSYFSFPPPSGSSLTSMRAKSGPLKYTLGLKYTMWFFIQFCLCLLLPFWLVTLVYAATVEECSKAPSCCGPKISWTRNRCGGRGRRRLQKEWIGRARSGRGTELKCFDQH